MIYAIQCGDNGGPIKIGITSDSAGRLMDLQVGCPYELRLLVVAAWPDQLETRLHRFCSSSRIRGEWFDSEGSRVQDVVAYLLDSANGLQRVQDELAAFEQRELEHKANRRRDKRLSERVAWWTGRNWLGASRA